MKLSDIQRSPSAFRESLLIDTDSGPAPLSSVMDPWQRTDFLALDPGWQAVVTNDVSAGPLLRAWLERGRGHSKTSDEATMIAWALFASRRPLVGYAAAADRDQAGLLGNALSRLTFLNPWLSKILEIQNFRVVNRHTDSCLEIISSDAATSYGLLPDFVICDELVHWKKRDLWDSLFSSSAKRASCLLVVITNAGIEDDWQYQLRQRIRRDTSWYFSRLDGPQASWITADRLSEQERLLPSIAFRRLWLNEWTSGGGDALTREQVDAAFRPDLRPHALPQTGYVYCAGLDLGITRDCSALCILGIRRGAHEHAQIRLAHTRIWRPARGTTVDLQSVEDEILRAHRRYHLRSCSYDPWQAHHLASRLQAEGLTNRDGVPMQQVTQTPANLQRQATALLEAFSDQRFQAYVEPDLHRDLLRLRVEERQYGFRLTSPRDETGHGDMATAFQLALLGATDLAAKRVARAGMLTEGETPLQRALAASRRNQAYEQMVHRLPMDEDADWRAAMKHVGRV